MICSCKPAFIITSLFVCLSMICSAVKLWISIIGPRIQPLRQSFIERFFSIVQRRILVQIFLNELSSLLEEDLQKRWWYNNRSTFYSMYELFVNLYRSEMFLREKEGVRWRSRIYLHLKIGWLFRFDVIARIGEEWWSTGYHLRRWRYEGSERRDSRMSSDIRDPVNIAEGLEDYAG